MHLGILKLRHVSFLCVRLLNDDNQFGDLFAGKAAKGIFNVKMNDFAPLWGQNCRCLQSATDLNTFHYSLFK